MKPAWDKLIEEYKASSTVLVADVDCTAAGKSLCETVGVQGFPTIKYGDPNNLEEYKEGRDFDSLKDFAQNKLGPSCGPANLDLCDDKKKATIAELLKMPEADLDAAIHEKASALEKIEQDFKSLVDGLQKNYQEANAKKDQGTKDIQDLEFRLMKSVAAKRGIRTTPRQSIGQWLIQIGQEIGREIGSILDMTGQSPWLFAVCAFVGGFLLTMTLGMLCFHCCMRKPAKPVKAEKQEEKAEKQD